MKAFLLAAGEGTRLRPLTHRVPKCLVPIKGKPLLHYWLRLCETYGIKEILINLHHLPHLVEEFLNKSSYRLKIRTFYEEKLLGSAGTIAANRDFVAGEEGFFIFYADNLTNVNLEKMRKFHKGHGGILTMGLFKANKPKECGIAELDRNRLVVEFAEKPHHPKSDLANAGVYMASPQIFDYIPHKEVVDWGFDVLPRLVGKMYGYLIKEYFLDIGTWENYKKAQKEWLSSFGSRSAIKAAKLVKGGEGT